MSEQRDYDLLGRHGRRNYVKPAIERLGSVAELTSGFGGGSTIDTDSLTSG